jgi:CubicO group peptidase (beta-lactamase class C family)
MRRTATLIATLTVLSLMLSCLPDSRFKTNFTVKPEQLDDGWQVTTPAEAGLDSAKVLEAYQMLWDENQYYNAKSLLVIRHSKLVFENYCRSASDRDSIAHIQSATKSLTSLVMGICRDQGWLRDLDTTLYAILPDKFDADTMKRRITLRHLLTMRSGIAFSNDHFSDDMVNLKPADVARYILAKPMYDTAGGEFNYRDCDPHLISIALKRITGRSLSEIARTKLFEPLGITDYIWEADGNGASWGGHGAFLKPRDMGKIGQMVLQKGVWNGQRVVSDSWVALSTSDQTGRLEGEDPPDLRYGFYWWVFPELNLFTAWGHGGQFICVLPDQDLVIVMTSMPSVNDDNVGTLLGEFLPLVRKIIGAVVN